jgi:hypothetical protein
LTDFGWTRLAYLLVVLSVLAVLAQLGSPSADPGNCPPNSRQATHGRGSPVAAREPHGHEDASLQASAARTRHPRFRETSEAGDRRRAERRGLRLRPGDLLPPLRPKNEPPEQRGGGPLDEGRDPGGGEKGKDEEEPPPDEPDAGEDFESTAPGTGGSEDPEEEEPAPETTLG